MCKIGEKIRTSMYGMLFRAIGSNSVSLAVHGNVRN